MDYKRLEKIVKGFANHRRIQILELLENRPVSLSQISVILRVNLKTVAEHTRRLESAGLITKNYKGREVVHTITSTGVNILKFLRKS